MTHEERCREWEKACGRTLIEEQREWVLGMMAFHEKEIGPLDEMREDHWREMIGEMATEEEMAAARPWTIEETREHFFREVWSHIDHLVERQPDVRKALTSLAFGIFTSLEGAGSFCGCTVIPSPHPDNKRYRRLRGQNWYPDEGLLLDGETHHTFIAMDPKRSES